MVELDLHISKRLKDLLPAHTPEELALLEANIIADGMVIDPVLYWHDGKRNLIVDGMTRQPIAKRNGIPYRTEPLVIEGGIEAVEIWILDHQLGRRNLLTPEAIRQVRGELYNRLKGGAGGWKPEANMSAQIERSSDEDAEKPRENAAKYVAEKSGVSEATVRRDGKRAELFDSLTKAGKVAAKDASDAELKAFAKLEPSDQDAVARRIRTGDADSISDALNLNQQKKRGKDAAAVEPDSTGTEADTETTSRTEGDSTDAPAGSVMLDILERPVPKCFRDINATGAAIQSLARKLDTILREVMELATEPGGAFLSEAALQSSFKSLKADLFGACYGFECPRCEGVVGKPCQSCKGTGWWPREKKGHLSDADKAWLGV